MKTKTITYWATTGLFALALTASGVMTLTAPPQMAANFQHLQLPLALATLLGVWKLLGVAALVAPRLPRLKEWAYAGFTFNLTGAAYFHAVAGDDAGKVITPLVLLGIAFASWATRPADRALTNRINEPTSLSALPVGVGLAANQHASERAA